MMVEEAEAILLKRKDSVQTHTERKVDTEAIGMARAATGQKPVPMVALVSGQEGMAV